MNTFYNLPHVVGGNLWQFLLTYDLKSCSFQEHGWDLLLVKKKKLNMAKKTEYPSHDDVLLCGQSEGICQGR